MTHKIELFTGNCKLCRDFLDELVIGKCAGCELTEHSMNSREGMKRAEKCGVKVVPTVIIDGRIKIEGRPDFPLICSDELYEFLRKNYPL
ncbi:MAG: thioredoxin family protein [Candidatus Aenigmarchaeota archaeon]|nr:thioredoxin family protein [Candidatus Aenigmarchaeota archaeon]